MGESGMIDNIQLQTNEYMNPDGTVRRVDQIAIHVMDMWLYKAISCKRDELLARRLADEQGIEVFDSRDGANAPPPLTEEEREEFGESLRAFSDMVKETDNG